MTAYSFMPWLRRGIGTELSGAGPGERATVPVRLQVAGEAVEGDRTLTTDIVRQVELYGPGDVVGIDRRAIVRTEPRDWVTNFEPNFLAFIEFYDEDFPWRYSPVAPDDASRRLRPWLAVIVLTEEEFSEQRVLPDSAAPSVELPDLGVLPPAQQLGAWAHVHVNRPVTASAAEVVSEDMAAVLPRLQALLDDNPDLACSRVICPRRLLPNEAYHAFLVPAFESGRLAGLGLDPAAAPAAGHSSWVPYPGQPAAGRLCYYHRWFFRTAPVGDFEYLVRLLKPRSLGARVGNRDMDVQRPGANLPGITDPALGGVLRLGGALKAPDSVLDEDEDAEAGRYENWDQPFPHPFQQALAALINLADDYAEQPPAVANQTVAGDDPDPLITPPLYGRWHALTSRLLTDRDGEPLDPDDNWVHELNLDPRFRVAAGLGAQVVRARQEEFMRAAWVQVGEVLEANRRIRAAQLAREVAYVCHSAHLEPLRAAVPGQAFAVTAPVHPRLVAAEVTGAVTVAHLVAESPVTAAPLSAPMRRVTRPRARLMRGLPFDAQRPRQALLRRVNAGEVTAAPAKTAPTGTITVEQLEGRLNPPPGPVPVGAVFDPVDDLPRSSDFIVTLPGDPFRPRRGANDSLEAVRFKGGLREIYAGFREADEASQEAPRDELALDPLGTATLAELNPDRTIPRRVVACLGLPERFRRQVAEEFTEAMAYPVIDLPMYRPLVELSDELFLPNVNQVPPNSITLVETNQRFIESYMVGVNHEMARELLWREYPTDQRGTPFRQFWDVSTVLPVAGEDPETARERLRDIPPLHRWLRRSALGGHDQRELEGVAEDELVLVIRGELLKRFPTAVIYAHRAVWQAPDGPDDPMRERRLIALSDAEEANPPRTKIRLPLYEAKVDPDIYFLGFDLTEEEARGGPHPGRRRGLVLRDQGAPRRAAVRARSGAHRPARGLERPELAGPAARWRRSYRCHGGRDARADRTAGGVGEDRSARRGPRADLARPDQLRGRRVHPVPGARADRRPRPGDAPAMSDAYDAAREAARAAVEAAVRAREAAAVAGERLAELRAGGADVTAAEAANARAAAEARAAAARGDEALSAFAALADPLRDGGAAAGEVSDVFPVLLGPVRLEMRFTETELLVRVFPDDWSVCAFEARPAVHELEAAIRHLVRRWRAGRVRGEQLAAWRDLVAVAGPGRAAWLVENHQALNPDEEPRKTRAREVVLVVAAEDPLPAADRAPASVYWTAIFTAGDDRAAIEAAEAALVEAVGDDRAAAIRAHRPAGLDDPAPESPEDVIVAFLHLPSTAGIETRPASWTRPVQARLLPDLFVLLGYGAGGQQVVAQTGAAIPDSLVVSPDPSLEAAEQLRVDDGELRVPEDLKWLVDLDRAVAHGMAFRVPLTDQIRGGLDRLVVLGLRTRSTPQQARAELETLISDQFHSSAGVRVVPQGTPTNNTAEASSGQERQDAAEESFAALFVRTHPNVPLEQWQRKTADRWLAELLGLGPRTFFPMPGGEATDQREARAMNLALWPATWGYHLQTTLHPIFAGEAGDATVDALRAFFAEYVSGCGPVPAIQIGRQPYGILPTTAYSRLAFPDDPVLRALHAVLTVAGGDWQGFAAQVPRVGDSGDPHRLLLDILGLHPASAEFHRRYLLSVEDFYNRLNLGGVGPQVLVELAELGFGRIGQLLTRLGYDPDGAEPDLMRRLVMGQQHKLRGPLIDDGPLSETEPVRPQTEDGVNYLQWLAERGRQALETVRREERFTADRPPRALLYLLLRHALMLSYHDTGLRLASTAGEDRDLIDAARREAPFVHVSARTQESESRFKRLYSAAPEVTGEPGTLLVDFIQRRVRGRHPDAAELAERLDAIELLADVPTARLERALTGHLDCCSYRFDALWLGLATERLFNQRYRPDLSDYRRGLHLGAYGWLENVRPRATALEPVTLSGELAGIFTPAGASPLVADPVNGGYLHAPSLSHAATATLLRSGYLADASPDNPGTLAVNLSSQRVRVALSFLEGVRSGRSLGELLGHQLERGLHDRHEMAEVDRFISALRRAFPLRSGRLPDTAAPPGTPIEAIEARNVVDGLALVRHVTRENRRQYPFGKPGLPDADPAQRAAIGAEVARLLDINDAIADLAIAESVHQTVLGNVDRAAATMDAYSRAGSSNAAPPPEPAVVETPHSGIIVTQRVALHVRAGVSPSATTTPRARAEPALNDWLARLLPRPEDVGCRVGWTDPVSGGARERIVTQADLGLQPIDLLWALRPEAEAAMGDLEDRIAGAVIEAERPRPDAALTIHYTEPVAEKVSFFQLSALIASVRALVLSARPLRPSDLVPPAGEQPPDPALDETVDLPRARLAGVRAALRDLEAALGAYVDDLEPLVAAGDRSALLASVDAFLARLAWLLVEASGFGLLVSGWSELAVWRGTLYAQVLAAVAEAAERIRARVTAADAGLAAYDALPADTPDDVRMRRLRRIERLLTTAPATPPPDTPDALRDRVGDLRAELAARLDGLDAVAGSGETTLAGLLADVRALLPLAPFDPTGLDLTPHEDAVVTRCADLLARAQSTRAAVADRLSAADAAIAQHEAAPDGPGRAAAGTAAIRAMLGEDAVVTTEFSVPASTAAEWRAVLEAADDGRLTAHLERDFPVDDWLHGVARVRDKMHTWERLTLLSGAIARREPTLLPAQFPYRDGDPWLALELPEDHAIDGDRLLYSAHYPPQFEPGGTHGGLLLDEWTEVIPARDQTTGIAFNYDRPGTEPPQSMLLVTPPEQTGAWRWDDLVAAVNETLDLVKTRAVDPAHLDRTAYAQVLPATAVTATPRPITISTDLGLNNLSATVVTDDG